MIPYWTYWSSLCFQQLIPFSIGYNCLYWLGYSLMQFPIQYLHIISGMSMSVGYPWWPRVIGWVSTCLFYPSDTLQGSSGWGCLSLSLVNHFLWLTLRMQWLYSLVRNWFNQFQHMAIVNCYFFFFHRPVLGGVLNLCWVHSEPSGFVLTSFWIHWFKSFLLGSQDLKVNLCELQQDICSDSVK